MLYPASVVDTIITHYSPLLVGRPILVGTNRLIKFLQREEVGSEFRINAVHISSDGIEVNRRSIELVVRDLGLQSVQDFLQGQD